MLILAVDTSGKYGSIALAEAGNDGSCRAIEVVPLSGGTFSAQLIPQIAALLGRHGYTKMQIDGFAVASGPGSFTGLRVGLAAMKGLAEVLQKPIAAVSLLEAVAAVGDAKGKSLAVLDAGRSEFYVGEYDPPEPSSERLLTGGELQERTNGREVISPDQSVQALDLHARIIERPRSDAIARLGWKKILAGETILPEQLDANYIRRSDAEIFSKQ